MSSSTDNSMSLWSVIEAMQRRLEAQGLDADVVDAAVTRGLEALLRRRDRDERPSLQPALS